MALAGIANATAYNTEPVFTGLGHGKLSYFLSLITWHLPDTDRVFWLLCNPHTKCGPYHLLTVLNDFGEIYKIYLCFPCFRGTGLAQLMDDGEILRSNTTARLFHQINTTAADDLVTEGARTWGPLHWLTSSPPNAAYMRQWTRTSLIRVMAGRLFDPKPLLEPMLAYCQLDFWEQISVKFESEFYNFQARKCSWRCRLPNWWPFCVVCVVRDSWVNSPWEFGP